MSEEKTKEEIEKELQEKFKNGVDISTFGFSAVAPTNIEENTEEEKKQ